MKIPPKIRAEQALSKMIAASGKGLDGWMRLVFDSQPVDTRLIWHGYQLGLFPFPDSDDVLRWRAPGERAAVVLNMLRFGRHLVSDIRRGTFEVAFDKDFEAVVRGCAEKTEGRPDTWLTEDLIQSYLKLHEMGCAHSAEARKDGELVGGAFGVAVGGYFCADSLYYRVPSASKVALAHLAEALRRQGFGLLDLQYPKKFSTRYGAITMKKAEFNRQLVLAQCKNVTFVAPEPFEFDPKAVMRELGTK